MPGIGQGPSKSDNASAEDTHWQFPCLERRVALFGKAHEMSGFAWANTLKIMPLIPGLAAAFIVTLSSKLAR